MKVELFAPPEYWKLTNKERAQFRCGPGRGVLEHIVPDTWRFPFIIYKPLVVTPACGPHDWYYNVPVPEGFTPDEWKKEADLVLRNNLIRLTWGQHITEHDPAWLLRYRLYLCEVYYKNVKRYGGPAFWSGKNKRSELGTV